MPLDPRLTEIEQADHEPVDAFRAEFAVVVDNMMSGYLRDPARTESMLRRDGMTRTADRLVELFGPEWGKQRTVPDA